MAERARHRWLLEGGGNVNRGLPGGKVWLQELTIQLAMIPTHISMRLGEY